MITNFTGAILQKQKVVVRFKYFNIISFLRLIRHILTGFMNAHGIAMKLLSTVLLNGLEEL